MSADPSDAVVFDAVVVGAGAGGLAAAARLNHYGYRTLLVERFDRVGGRASTVDIDGFKVNTGAIIIELGGDNGVAFSELGVDMGTRVARCPLVLRVGRRDIPLMTGLTGKAFQGALEAVGALARRRPGMRPQPGLSTEDWLQGLTARPFVHGLMRNVTAAIFAAEPSDVEACVVFDYLTRKNAFKTYAFHPEGTIGSWKRMAAHFEATGGVLWLNSTVLSFTFDDAGLIDGVLLERDGELVTVATRLVVSNAGPAATAQMCGDGRLPQTYLDELRTLTPSTLMTVNFASRQRLSDLPGLAFFGPTRRLAYAANFTDTCPEMAPPGWHLYVGAGCPHPAVGPFDHEAELELLKQDLREHFPGFDQARVLSVEFTTGPDWPAQRAIAGQDLPTETPIANLWNVGDAVRQWATGGISACVESARLVTDAIRRQYPATLLRGSGAATGSAVGRALVNRGVVADVDDLHQ